MGDLHMTPPLKIGVKRPEQPKSRIASEQFKYLFFIYCIKFLSTFNTSVTLGSPQWGVGGTPP